MVNPIRPEGGSFLPALQSIHCQCFVVGHFSFNAWWFFKLKVYKLFSEVRYSFYYWIILEKSIFHKFWHENGLLRFIWLVWKNLAIKYCPCQELNPGCCRERRPPFHNTINHLPTYHLKTFEYIDKNSGQKGPPLGSQALKTYVGSNRVKMDLF